MIDRKANESILDFFKNDKRALLVTGARQVGSVSEILSTFAAENKFNH